MKIKEYKAFSIRKIEAFVFEELKEKGFISRDIKVDANFTNKKMIEFKRYIKMFYDCTFEFEDSKTNAKIGYIKMETETLINFDNTKKIFELWKNDKKTFNKNFSGILGNYVFNEVMPIVSIISKFVHLPAPIPSPFIKPQENKDKKK